MKGEISMHFPYELALTAIVRDEAPYIKEWLDYHILLGVGHFYIYDNESHDALMTVLRPYIDAGWVTYQKALGENQQLPVYADALVRYRMQCRYMGFIDIDEFILPLQKKSVIDIISQALQSSPQAAGLAINCKSFGSSGWEQRPAVGGVLDSYLYRAPDGFDWSEFPWKWDAHVKSIVDPRRTTAMVSPHHAKYQAGYMAVDEKGRRVDGMDNFVDDTATIRINHYFTKSLAEWVDKRNKGCADCDRIRPMEEFFWRDRNDVYDDLIVRYREHLWQQWRSKQRHQSVLAANQAAALR